MRLQPVEAGDDLGTWLRPAQCRLDPQAPRKFGAQFKIFAREFVDPRFQRRQGVAAGMPASSRAGRPLVSHRRSGRSAPALHELVADPQLVSGRIASQVALDVVVTFLAAIIVGGGVRFHTYISEIVGRNGPCLGVFGPDLGQRPPFFTVRTHLRLHFARASRKLGRVSEGEITLVLQRIEQGDPQASAQLLPLVYDELRHLAAARLARENPGQTLQPTALVHEVWLRIGHNQAMWNNRAHFFAAAAEAMRRILIDNARRKHAARHGGQFEHVSADATGFDVPTGPDDDELLLVNDALDALAAHDPRKADLVKQKYFVGLTLEEIAEVQGISHRTAKRDWAYARAWLYEEVQRLRSGGA